MLMMESYVLTEEIVKNLKCSLCHRFLSVSPVSIVSEDGTKYKCGRCHSIKTHIETRAIMYENLAKFMLFPCIYKSCTEKLKWGEVREHEKKCPLLTVVCPRANCDEVIGIKDFALHFKEKHNKAYHSDKLILNNVHNYYSLDVLHKDGSTYIIIFDHDDTRFGISVCSLEPDNHQYELILSSDSKKVSIIVTEQKVIQFEEKTHCFKCVMGVCKSEFHVYRYYKKGLLKRMTTKIDRDTVSRTFRGRILNYTLNIVDVKPEPDDLEDLEDDLIVKDMVIDEVNDDEEEVQASKEEEIIRRMLECPNCFEYMLPPIYQCVTGHTTCKKCKLKLEKCSTCQAQIEETRNFSLEEVAGSLKLPAVSEKSSQMEGEHQEITCPTAQCHDKFNLQDIGMHFKEKHMDYFHWNNFTVKNVYAYFNVDVLVRYGKTYIVLFDYNDSTFGVSICSVCGPDDCEYEVKLTSEDGKFSILASQQSIIPFDESEHCLKCLSGTCKNNQHKYRLQRKTIFKRLTTKFNRDSVNRTFNYSLLNYVITIIDSKKVFLRELALKKDAIFRKMYECPVCKGYMTQPIHQCLVGHSICSTCKANLEKCPSCEGKIENTRNYILEEVSENVELPCQFASETCVFRAGIKRVASHEEECALKRKKLCVEQETDAKTKEKDVKSKEKDVKTNETDAKSKETDAKTKETEVKTKETEVKTEEAEAKTEVS